MEKFLRTTYFLLLAGIVMLSGIFLQTMPAAQAASQFMDYFQATPIIGSLSSSCWGAAAVGPRDQSNGLEDKTMTQYCYWDGGIIKGSDGLYHMFASRWAQSGGHNGWFGSVAVHATSSNLYGPYTDKGLCWPNNQSGKGHNVFPFVGGDGKFYIIVSDTRPGDIFQATSLNGPWTQLGTISTSGNFGQLANISVMYRPDGRYMAVPRSGVIGISNNVLGTYTVQGTSAYVQAGVPSGNLEDPVVWYSGGKYHIVVNKWDTRKAYHITSTDGINGWTLGPGLAYDPTANFIRYTNGTVNHWNKLERFNVYIENGHIVAGMLAAIDVAKDQDLGNDQHGSKVIVIPFDGAGLDGGSNTPTPGPRSAFSQIEAESFNSQSGVQTESCGEGGQNVGYIENGDYVVYNSVDFGGGATGFQARVASGTSGGNIEIRLDSTSGTLVGTCSVAGTGGWQTWATRTCTVSGASGTHNLYLRFTGGSGYLMNLNWFKFTTGTQNTPTPTPTGTVNTPTPTQSGSYVKFRNVATGLYIDGMGSTSNGANACQYASSTSNNQQWTLEAAGSNYKIKNRATGLYLDGMGRTSNGSICGQWSSSSSTNQQWIQEAAGSNYKYKNVASGLYLDGMGSTGNGSNLCQWSSSSSTNQQFQKQ